MRARKLSGLLVAGGLLLGAVAAPAGADPKGDTFTVVCDNGITYHATGNGNGDFTPAHDVNSTATLVPLSFGPFSATVTDSEGNVVETINEPGSSKGQSGKQAKNTVSCTYSFSGSEDGLTFTGSGSVVGYVTPRGRA